MNIFDCKDETKKLVLEYDKNIEPIGTFSLDPDMPEEELVRLLNKALKTGTPIPEEVLYGGLITIRSDGVHCF